MTERARAFWVTAPGQGALRETALAAPGPGEVLVRTRCSGISRGTESIVFAGRVPRSQYQAMRGPFQEGDFPAPVKYGYASVGIVERGTPALLGRRVFCFHPHQDRYVVPEAAVLPVPDAVPDRRAVLAANMETALNGLWDGAPRLCDRVIVVGAGTVGALAAALAQRIPGVETTIVDIDPGRAALAQQFGCGFALPGGAAGDADLVIHASGSPEGLVTALRLAGFEATVLDLSWYGDRPVSLPLGEAFHPRRLRLVSSQVGAVATARRARRSPRLRLMLALDLLADPVFDHLLTGETAFADLPATMACLATAPAGTLCHVVRYDEG